MRTAVLILTFCLCVHAQTAPQAASKGLPARATPGDYQTQAKAGGVTIAAEFTAHSLPTVDGPLNTDDYIGVEVALFGPEGTPLKISAADFSLRVNGKKTLDSQPFVLLMPSLRDPEWIPPEAPEKKSKSSMSGGGGGQGGESSGPPPPVKVPVAEQRAWTQRLQKAALAEGDRPLPQAGLLFFAYHGKTKGIESVELTYHGPAGTTTLKLQ